MKKILSLALLSLVISCSSTPTVKFVKVPLPIPAHKTLPVLTQEELQSLKPEVRAKLETMKAMLIGNIMQLEEIIKEYNSHGKD